ncbi:MAG: hypothetical protein U0470_00265 [Anaerolineae bacterium]
MHTRFLSASLSLGLIVAVGAAADARNAAAADASHAVVTVQSHCASRVFTRPVERRVLECVAIYRNNSDRPVFDIGIDGKNVKIGGSPAVCEECGPGTRIALSPSESGIVWMWIAEPNGAPNDPRLELSYRASWTGDERELDVPKPELQYIDRVQGSGGRGLIGEVRNVDGRTWQVDGDDRTVSRTPIIAYFSRGKLVGAENASRVPYHRIGADGRYIFRVRRDGPDLTFDAVQVFFRDEFVSDRPTLTDARLQLTGLSHTVGADSSGRQRLAFRISVRNLGAWPSRGVVYAIARRADYHAIGIAGDCLLEVSPGAEASCSSSMLLDLRPDVTVDDVHFVTVEIGGAFAFQPTPTPIPSATPCPEWRTPPPMATLVSVAERLWLPWSLRMQADRLCR